MKELSTIYGDSGYTNYEIEDDEAENIYLQIERKSNTNQRGKPSLAFIKNE